MPSAKKTPAKKSERRPQYVHEDSDAENSDVDNDPTTDVRPNKAQPIVTGIRQPDFDEKVYTVEVPSFKTVNGVTQYCVRTLLDGTEQATVYQPLSAFKSLHANLGFETPFPCKTSAFEWEFFHDDTLREERRSRLDTFMKETVGSGTSHGNLKSVLKFFLQSAVSDKTVCIEVPSNQEADDLFEKLKQSQGLKAVLETIGNQGEIIKAQEVQIEMLEAKVTSLEAALEELEDEIEAVKDEALPALETTLTEKIDEVVGEEASIRMRQISTLTEKLEEIESETLPALEKKLTEKIDELESTWEEWREDDRTHEELQAKTIKSHGVSIRKLKLEVSKLKGENEVAAKKAEDEAAAKDKEDAAVAEKKEAERKARKEKRRLAKIEKEKEEIAAREKWQAEVAERLRKEVEDEKVRVAEEAELKAERRRIAQQKAEERDRLVEKAERLRIKREKERRGGKLNINTCSKADLMQLDYVSDVRAELIMDHRPYRKQATLARNLMSIHGISEETTAKVMQSFYVA